MSKFLKSIRDVELSEIDPQKSSYVSKRNKEGDRCLFYKRDEVTELVGHEVKFYENGVLLVLLDYAKDYSKDKHPNLKIESQSYIFYNNEEIKDMTMKQPVFEIHNRNKNKQTMKILPPVKDIEIRVFKHYLYVKSIDTEENTTTEYVVDVLTGKKTFAFDESNQISIDF